MKKKICVALFFLILHFLILSFTSCTEKNNSHWEKRKAVLEGRLFKMKQKVLTKKPEKLNSFVGSKENHIFFYFTQYDCLSCVEIGFSIINSIDSLMIEDSVIVIGNEVDIGASRIHYGYEGFIYLDKDDIIRTDFNYTYTPFIAITDTAKIVDIFFIQSSDYFYNNITTIADSIYNIYANN